jgi:plastocyanin
MFSKKSITIMLIVIGVLVVFIAGLFLWKNYSSRILAVNQNQIGNNSATTTLAASIEAGKKATENLVSNIEKNAENPNSYAKVEMVNRIVDGKTTTEEAVSVAKGSTPISTRTGEVIARTGDVAQNSAAPGSVSSPTPSLNVDPNKLPDGTIKLTINTDNSITPNSFSAHPGQAVSWALINNTSWSETILFDDPSLSALVFSLAPGMTKAVTFNAPMKTGEYVFASDLSFQRNAGMLGKMIVK